MVNRFSIDSSLPQKGRASPLKSPSPPIRQYFSRQDHQRVAGEFFITRTKFNVVTGAVIRRIDDKEMETPFGSGHNLVSDFIHDNQGKNSQRIVDVDTTMQNHEDGSDGWETPATGGIKLVSNS